MELSVLEIIIGIAILLLSFHYYLTWNFNFWKSRNVQGPKPIPFFGNFKNVVLGKMHAALLLKNFYDEYKSEPVIGVYVRSTPFLIIRDADLIKDFTTFSDRGHHVDKKTDRYSENLLNLEYKRWRALRNKLTPVFTSGKLKDMFYLMIKSADHFEKYLDKLSELDEPIECRELTAKFTTQSIGVCIFGLNTEAFDENSEFRKYGRAVFDTTFKNIVRRRLRELFPEFYRLLGPWLQTSATEFFARSLKETIKYRKQKNVRRNDFVDLLMDLQNQSKDENSFEFTDGLITAQALAFFIAGFETSSTTTSNALYELALNQNIQDKLREEVTNLLQENGGRISFDLIKSMKYLDKVIKETLRKYPPGGALHRKASSSYTFNGTKITIPENTKVFIPVLAVHRNPEIYPDPETFDPERFNEENEQNRHPMHYLPFGSGPRNCIGARFAMYQTQVGVVTLLNKFRVDVCDKTCNPYVMEPQSLILIPVGGIYLKIIKV